MPKPKVKCVDSLRYNEYYDMQNVFDELYEQSKNGSEFSNLMDIILNENNILLSYRNIKLNGGSKTPGTDGKTIKDIAEMEPQQVVDHVRKIMRKSQNGYNPKAVRRKEIPKPNGAVRALGIPCIWDRLIQQCIKQVLEPICEAKFSENSYGFRPNRSVENAIARTYRMLQMSNLHYVIEFDIKDFFDNVNHSKLVKQIWAMGIHDRELIFNIKRILRAPVKISGNQLEIPERGISQGGILSPLLANIVLNELDRWIESQWQHNPVIDRYTRVQKLKNGKEIIDHSHGYRALKESTRLKEMWIVRYADDFRIFCRNPKDAQKTKIAVEQWMKERLKLEISQEKTRIINTRKKRMEFLGFSIKVHKKKKDSKYVVISHISKKALKLKGEKLANQIKIFCKYKDSDKGVKEVVVYNSMVLGIQNYYRIATSISKDLNSLQMRNYRIMYNRLNTQKSNMLRRTGRRLNEMERKRFGKSRSMRFIAGTGEPIYPVSYVQFKNPMALNQKINSYTKEGRELIHDDLKINYNLLRALMQQKIKNGSIEYYDNRISLYSEQSGKCYITGEKFPTVDEIHCHHKIAKSQGGTDEYSNLVLVGKDAHKLIHAKKSETINNYLEKLQIKADGLRKINSLRKILGLPIIIRNKKCLSLSYN